MRVVDRLAERDRTWQELDVLLCVLDGRPPRARREMPPGPPNVSGQFLPHTPMPVPTQARPLAPNEVIRLGELYRAACADLMLAEAYDLPRETVAYLHALVARAHNALYRSRGFKFRQWAAELFGNVPRRLRRDPLLRISAILFYGSFLVFALLAAARPKFAEQVVGQTQLERMEDMYSADFHSEDGPGRDDATMAGFYIFNNASIGLRCFAFGLLFGVGTIYILLSNGMMIGVVFGHMLTSPNSVRFYSFVTSHAPFELTAIVFAGAAGLRLGYGLIVTHGLTRTASLRREAHAALPTAGAAVFLFVLAAFLEGFVSASLLPYAVKAAIAVVSASLLLLYLALGGRAKVA